MCDISLLGSPSHNRKSKLKIKGPSKSSWRKLQVETDAENSQNKLLSKEYNSEDCCIYKKQFRCTNCFVSHFPWAKVCTKAKFTLSSLSNAKKNFLLAFLGKDMIESESHYSSPDYNSIKRLKGGANIENISKMIRYGIESAKKHGIVLVPGVRNNADGNCTFEAVLNNINYRNCFAQTFGLHPNVYRRRWITQLEKDSEHHPVLGAMFSEEEKRQNWNKLKNPYVYEVSFFGDYVIHGIAKGCQKIF